MTDTFSRSTLLTRLGRSGAGWANPPIIKGSTYLFEDLEQWREARRQRAERRVLTYGARGNETVFALEDAITALEGGYRSKLFPTGLAAIAATFLAYLKAGDHVLLSEGVYDPARQLCETQLANYGITASYFDPRDPDWQAQLRPNTRMVYVESPASLLYDMLDLPAISAVCRARGILLCADNTWGSSLSYRPLELGCDVSVVAATKYLGGHSDVVLGSVTTTEACFADMEKTSVNLGQMVSAEDAFLVLRGIRTLDLRLERHARSALEIAAWLRSQAAIKTVFHPALDSDPNHALWKRDAQGSNGLLTVEFDPALDSASVERAIGELQIFGIGSSWGGYESLILPVDLRRTRYRDAKQQPGYLLRLHIGLEDRQDLQADLERLLGALPAQASE